MPKRSWAAALLILIMVFSGCGGPHKPRTKVPSATAASKRSETARPRGSTTQSSHPSSSSPSTHGPPTYKRGQASKIDLQSLPGGKGPGEPQRVTGRFALAVGPFEQRSGTLIYGFDLYGQGNAFIQELVRITGPDADVFQFQRFWAVKCSNMFGLCPVDGPLVRAFYCSFHECRFDLRLSTVSVGTKHAILQIGSRSWKLMARITPSHPESSDQESSTTAMPPPDPSRSPPHSSSSGPTQTPTQTPTAVTSSGGPRSAVPLLARLMSSGATRAIG